FLSAACPLNVRVSANSPSLCPTMFSLMNTGTCWRPLWTAMVRPTNSGSTVERRDQVLIGRLSLELTAASTFLSRWASTNGPFLTERAICIDYPLFLAAALDDHVVRPLVATSLVALGRLAPRRHRVAVAAGAAAVRVIDRVHDLAADRRPDPAPALGAGLADLAQAVLLVAHLADRGAAVDVESAHLARAHPHLGVDALAGHQPRRGAGGAGDLGALAGGHLDRMDSGSDRDVPDGQRVPGPDGRVRAALQPVARHDPARGEDVATLAVGIAQQRDVGAAVRVVLDPLDGGGDAVLVATEVDDPVVGLVAAPAMAHGDAAVVVAAGVLLLTRRQGIEGPTLVQVRRDDPHHRPAARRGGFHLDDSHLTGLHEIDLLARGQRDVRLAGVAAPARVAAEALGLALLVQHLDRLDLDLGEQLVGRLDLGLGRILQHVEGHLVVLLGHHGRLLRHDGADEHFHQTLLVHPSISWTFASAGRVISTRSNRTSDTGSASRGSTMSTSRRLRAARQRLSSKPSVMIRTDPRPMSLSFCTSSLVLGASTLISSTTASRSSRASCERIEHTPARYIFLFSLWLKFSSGVLGNARPPPRHSGLEV